jgi:hypothetical protein
MMFKFFPKNSTKSILFFGGKYKGCSVLSPQCILYVFYGFLYVLFVYFCTMACASCFACLPILASFFINSSFSKASIGVVLCFVVGL